MQTGRTRFTPFSSLQKIKYDEDNNLLLTTIENDFYDIECTEQIVRTIEAREGKTRHSFRSIGHTTYVAFARKVYSPKKKITAVD